MEIKLKYNYQDTLWYMEKNKPTQITINEFRVRCEYSGYADGGWGTERTYPIKIYYRDRINYLNDPNAGWIPEYLLFKTKEELLQSL